MSSQKPKSIPQRRKELSKINAQSEVDLAAFQKLEDELEPITRKPLAENLKEVIKARIQRAENRRFKAEYLEWNPASRAITGVQNYLEGNAVEICATWNDTIKTRSNQLPGILANYGKRFEALKAAFESGDTREANRKKRDAIEEEVETLEESIQTAKTAVRSFELMPTLEAFESADALVNKITLPNS